MTHEALLTTWPRPYSGIIYQNPHNAFVRAFIADDFVVVQRRDGGMWLLVVSVGKKIFERYGTRPDIPYAEKLMREHGVWKREPVQLELF